MRILGIETSCDETAIAIVEDGRHVIQNILYSQVQAHQKYGGVMPELASRMHTEKIHGLLQKCMTESQLTWSQIDACAVTTGPGLEGALLIGIATAKTIAALQNIPLLPINHLQGHLYANFIETEQSPEPPPFPYIGLIASGGHTELVKVHNQTHFELLGRTRDDAIGEAFDKVARHLDLSYPGGPEIEKCATSGDPNSYPFTIGLKSSPYEFSFSGLKTAVIQTRKKHPNASTEDICASFQKTAIETLLRKTITACHNHHCHTLVLSGGVIANQTLCATFKTACQEEGIRLFYPPREYCTDNAAMIATAAYHQYHQHLKEIRNCQVEPKKRVNT